VQAGPFVGSGPLNTGTDTGRTSSDLMTGGTVTQPREVQSGPFVGSGPLNTRFDTGRSSSDLMTGGTVLQPRKVQTGLFVTPRTAGELQTRTDASRTVREEDDGDDVAP